MRGIELAIEAPWWADKTGGMWFEATGRVQEDYLPEFTAACWTLSLHKVEQL